MNRTFNEISRVVSTARKKKGITQQDLAVSLGYRNGQYISNVERSQCGLPGEKVYDLGKILGIDPVDLIEAMVLDYSVYLCDCIKESKPPELPKRAPLISAYKY